MVDLPVVPVVREHRYARRNRVDVGKRVLEHDKPSDLSVADDLQSRQDEGDAGHAAEECDSEYTVGPGARGNGSAALPRPRPRHVTCCAVRCAASERLSRVIDAIRSQVPQALRLEIDLRTLAVVSGETAHGHARITNVGDGPTEFWTSGTVFAGVRLPGQDGLAGEFHGPRAAVGPAHVRLLAGGVRDLHLLVGTATGYDIGPEPGPYEVVATAELLALRESGRLIQLATLTAIGPTLEIFSAGAP
jgi:hypothetical protein